MDTRERQKELFGEYEGEKPRFKAPRNLLVRPTAISVPLERVIFIGIGILMTLVVVYALGVERGKALAKCGIKARPAAKPRLYRAPASPAKAAPAAQAVPQAAELRPYTVLLATFRQRALADAEALKLKREGYAPFLTEQGEYLRLYAGRFASFEDAVKAQNALKAIYKECAIKKFQQGGS